MAAMLVAELMALVTVMVKVAPSSPWTVGGVM